jgi:outer membrane protein
MYASLINLFSVPDPVLLVTRRIATFWFAAACVAAVQPLAWGADAAAAVMSPQISLSLRHAIEVAISPGGSTATQLAEEIVNQAKARSTEARADFLPDLESAVGETNLVRSLGQLGLGQVKLPFGLQVPTIVGPYDVVDIRASVSETFDFSSIRRYQATRANITAAKADRENAANVVAATVARAYLEVLRTQAQVEASGADVELAQAVLAQAGRKKTAGTGTAIEITRAQLQLSNDRQRQLVLQSESRKSQFELLRAIGLPLDTAVDLTSRFSESEAANPTFEDALSRAFRSRADLKAQQAHDDSARLMASAGKYDRLPSITGFADYGTTGQGVGEPLLPTREYGVILRLPVFDGGRRDAQRSEMASAFRSEKLRTRDLRAQVELEVREALDSLHSAEDQMRVAAEGLTLADNELTQARRRYEAGVTNGLEVTEAQTRMTRARTNQIEATFNYNLARVDLGQATGDVQSVIQ